MEENYALEISGVTKSFVKREDDERGGSAGPLARLLRRTRKRVTVLDHVTLRVPRGAIYGVLGPNGSGKSTLIRMIATLLIPDAGEIRVFGRNVVKEPLAVQRMINRVSVDAAFFRKLSAMENLLYAGRLYGLSADQAKRRSRRILEQLGFDEKKLDCSMSELSRGMQQKVAVARGFLTSPILLLLDEPTTGLDPKSKRDVQEFIRRLRNDHDATILLTTHDMAEAEALCDRIAILCRGKIVALDTVAGLKASLRNDGADPTLEDVFLKLTGERLCEDEEER